VTLVGSLPVVVDAGEFLVLFLQFHPSERVLHCQIAALCRIQVWYSVASISLFRIARGTILESEAVCRHSCLSCFDSGPYLTRGPSDRPLVISGKRRYGRQNNSSVDYRSGYQTSDNLETTLRCGQVLGQMVVRGRTVLLYESRCG
jgi:hypothetical protein